MFFKRSFQRNKAVAGFAQTKADKLGELFHEEGNKAYRNVVHKYSDERGDRADRYAEPYLVKTDRNDAGDDLIRTVDYTDERYRAAGSDSDDKECDDSDRNGCEQVVFLDAVERKWIEELGGMNVFFVFDDGSLQTPPLGGTILAGITRDSLIRMAREAGLTVREEPYSIDQWREDAKSGRLVEAFACGTAAVVTPVGKVASHEGEFTIGSGGPGQLTRKLKDRLVSIQRGEAPDPYGWVMKLD